MADRLAQIRNRIVKAEQKARLASVAVTVAKRDLKSEVLRQARAALAKADITEGRSVVTINDYKWREADGEVLLCSLSVGECWINSDHRWMFTGFFRAFRKDGKPKKAMIQECFVCAAPADLAGRMTLAKQGR
jgi:hypothetical protein